MPEEMTEVAAPSAAEETPATPQVDPSRGALVELSPEQRSEYKKTGVLPEKPKPEARHPHPRRKPRPKRSQKRTLAQASRSLPKSNPRSPQPKSGLLS